MAVNGNSITITGDDGQKLVIEFEASGALNWWSDGSFKIDYPQSSFNSITDLSGFITQHIDEIRQDMRSIVSDRFQAGDGNEKDDVTYDDVSDVGYGISDSFRDAGSMRAANQNLVSALAMEAVYLETLDLKTATERGNVAYDRVADAAAGNITKNAKDRFLQKYSDDLQRAVSVLEAKGIETTVPLSEGGYGDYAPEGVFALIMPQKHSVFHYSGPYKPEYILENEAEVAGRMRTLIREGAMDENGAFSEEKLADIERRLETNMEMADGMSGNYGETLALLNAAGLNLVTEIRQVIAQQQTVEAEAVASIFTREEGSNRYIVADGDHKFFVQLDPEGGSPLVLDQDEQPLDPQNTAFGDIVTANIDGYQAAIKDLQDNPVEVVAKVEPETVEEVVTVQPEAKEEVVTVQPEAKEEVVTVQPEITDEVAIASTTLTYDKRVEDFQRAAIAADPAYEQMLSYRNHNGETVAIDGLEGRRTQHVRADYAAKYDLDVDDLDALIAHAETNKADPEMLAAREGPATSDPILNKPEIPGVS